MKVVLFPARNLLTAVLSTLFDRLVFWWSFDWSKTKSKVNFSEVMKDSIVLGDACWKEEIWSSICNEGDRMLIVQGFFIWVQYCYSWVYQL